MLRSWKISGMLRYAVHLAQVAIMIALGENIMYVMAPKPLSLHREGVGPSDGDGLFSWETDEPKKWCMFVDLSLSLWADGEFKVFLVVFPPVQAPGARGSYGPNLVEIPMTVSSTSGWFPLRHAMSAEPPPGINTGIMQCRADLLGSRRTWGGHVRPN